MNKTLVLLKIGGGLISDKTIPQTARPKVMTSVAKEIKAAKLAVDFDLVIGTGAGSFGHFTAHEYGLRHGATTSKQLYGMCKTHAEVAHLNALFTDTLLKAGLPAFSIPPSAIMASSDRLLTATHFATLDHALAHNIIPVLHGDGIPDAKHGITIFSTERVLEACLQHFHKKYSRIAVVYLTNEKGVLDKHGEPIPELGTDSSLQITSTLTHDVTGGMLEKIAAARQALTHGATEAYIADGHQKGVLQTLLAGKPTGTRVL